MNGGTGGGGIGRGRGRSRRGRGENEEEEVGEVEGGEVRERGGIMRRR